MTQLRKLLSLDRLQSRSVCRAVIDSQRTVVLKQQAIFDVGSTQFQARISVQAPRCSFHRITTRARGTWINENDGIVWDQQVVVIDGVEVPANLQLPEVIETGGVQRLRFSLAQRGQKEARQNGDDCDNHE